MLVPMNVVMCCHYCLLSMYRLLLQGCDGEKRRGRPSCLESERRERRHREAGRESAVAPSEWWGAGTGAGVGWQRASSASRVTTS